MSGYVEALVVMLAINIVVAQAGYLPLAAGQLNLGVAGFMAIGAYASAYICNTFGLPIVVGIVVGAVAAWLVAVVLAVPLLRASGIYLALATFALGQVIQAIFLNVETVGAAAGYPVRHHASFWLVMGTTAVVFAGVVFLSRTRFALYLTAVKNDPVISDLFGVSVRNIKVQAFSLGALIAGVGGALYAHHFNYLEPQTFNIMLSVYIVLYVLLGGTQTVLGPVIGAAFFTLLPELLRGSAQWRYVVFAAFIIGLMALRPQGLITSDLMRKLSFRKERLS